MKTKKNGLISTFANSGTVFKKIVTKIKDIETIPDHN